LVGRASKLLSPTYNSHLASAYFKLRLTLALTKKQIEYFKFPITPATKVYFVVYSTGLFGVGTPLALVLTEICFPLRLSVRRFEIASSYVASSSSRLTSRWFFRHRLASLLLLPWEV
jgi:hypothetical protein